MLSSASNAMGSALSLQCVGRLPQRIAVAFGDEGGYDRHPRHAAADKPMPTREQGTRKCNYLLWSAELPLEPFVCYTGLAFCRKGKEWPLKGMPRKEKNTRGGCGGSA
jgi:hypothetical protein